MSVCAVMLSGCSSEVERLGSCLVWRGPSRKGRPLLRLGKVYVYAHRRLWEETHGEQLDSRTVLMRQCERTLCVNPEHYRKSRRVLGLPPREPTLPEQQRAWNLRRYGISPEMYDEMSAEQGGVCAVCRRKNPDKLGRRLHVDHCHETGTVRGLLCTLCNNAIGQAGDDPERLRDLANYIERSIVPFP